MSYKLIPFLVLLLVLTHSEVVVLDDSNYTSFVQAHPFVFVKFYAPWCGHCKAMANDYIQLAQASIGKEYVIAEVDSTVAINITSQLGIKGYPTIKFIAWGNVLDFEGDRSAKFMQNWIQNLLKAEIKQITEDELKSLIGKQNLVVVRGATKEQLKFVGLSQQISKVPFYSIEGGKYKLTAYLKNSIIAEYYGEPSIKQIADWITQQTLGHLVAMSSQTIVKQIFENKQRLPSLLLFKNLDFTEQAFQILSSYCHLRENDLKCGYTDQSHEIYKGIAHFLKAESNEISILAYLDYGIKNGYKFPNISNLSHQTLDQFLIDVNRSNIQKFHDEQQIKQAKRIKYTNVVKLANQTFNDTLKNNKYVFVQYYTATCGKCVKFAPEYEQFATKLKEENSEFMIAAVEEPAIKQQVEVSNFPSFRFYVQGEEIEYTGPHNTDSMINFMNVVIKSRLKTANSLQQLHKPAIAVYGISEDSPFHLLPFIYTRFPIYQILQYQSEFKVQIHQKKFITYSGEKDLKTIARWLEENTQPIIVNVVQKHPTKRLSKALEDSTPLLVIINRDNSETFKTAYNFLNTYCEGKTEFLCGIANVGDSEYQNFNDWVGDYYNENSALIYLNTIKFTKYLYEGELAALNEESLNTFITGIKEEKIQPYKGKVDIEIDATNAGKEQQTQKPKTEEAAAQIKIDQTQAQAEAEGSAETPSVPQVTIETVNVDQDL